MMIKKSLFTGLIACIMIMLCFSGCSTSDLAGDVSQVDQETVTEEASDNGMDEITACITGMNLWMVHDFLQDEEFAFTYSFEEQDYTERISLMSKEDLSRFYAGTASYENDCINIVVECADSEVLSTLTEMKCPEILDAADNLGYGVTFVDSSSSEDVTAVIKEELGEKEEVQEEQLEVEEIEVVDDSEVTDDVEVDADTEVNSEDLAELEVESSYSVVSTSVDYFEKTVEVAVTKNEEALEGEETESDETVLEDSESEEPEAEENESAEPAIEGLDEMDISQVAEEIGKMPSCRQAISVLDKTDYSYTIFLDEEDCTEGIKNAEDKVKEDFVIQNVETEVHLFSEDKINITVTCPARDAINTCLGATLDRIVELADQYGYDTTYIYQRNYKDYTEKIESEEIGDLEKYAVAAMDCNCYTRTVNAEINLTENIKNEVSLTQKLDPSCIEDAVATYFKGRYGKHVKDVSLGKAICYDEDSWRVIGTCKLYGYKGTFAIRVTGKTKSPKIASYKVLDGSKTFLKVSKLKKVKGVKSKKTDSTTIKVSWKKVSGASGYKIYRKAYYTGESSDSEFKLVKTIKKGSTTSYVDKDKKRGKKYIYKIKAYVKVGDNVYVGPVSAKTSKVIKPRKVRDLDVDSRKSTGATIVWTSDSNAYGYKVYCRKAGKENYVLVKTITDCTKDYYTFKNLSSNTKYYFKVREYTKFNGNKYTGAASVVSAKTKSATVKKKSTSYGYSSGSSKSSSTKYKLNSNYQSSNGSRTVYITKTGKAYHIGGCRHARNSTAVSLSTAQSKGLKPCGVCHPLSW